MPVTPAEDAYIAREVIDSLEGGGPFHFELVPAKKGSGLPRVDYYLVNPPGQLGVRMVSITLTAQDGDSLRTADLDRLTVDKMIEVAEVTHGVKRGISYRVTRKRGRPRVLTDDHLARVLQVAETNPDNPRQAVGRAFDVSYATAGRYLQAAREMER